MPTKDSQHGEPGAPRWTREDSVHALLIVLLAALVMCMGCVGGDPATPGSAAHDRDVCTLTSAMVTINATTLTAVPDSLRYLCRP